jgi:uncharacterized SAM-binding protein YcdF (DUF218 family)
MDHYTFLLKKILGALLMPIPVMLLLLLWALLLMLKRKTRWLGYLVVLLVTIMLFVCSYAPLTSPVLNSFENTYPPYQQPQEPVDYIVVLGSWHQSARHQPVTSEIKPSGIVRLAEGIRIYYLNPGSKLVFTGYHGIDDDPVSYPDKLRELALALHIPSEDILIFDGPRDTSEEAQLIARVFSQKKLVLVTTAMHMPRALGLFRGQGLDPIPAPTEHFGKPQTRWWSFPQVENLESTSYWVHEQLGILWAELLGQIKKKISKEP